MRRVSADKDKRPWFLAITIPGSIVLVLASLVWIIASIKGPEYRPDQVPAAAPTQDAVVNAANYDKLREGMTYNDVVAILGAPGHVVSEGRDSKIIHWRDASGPTRSINGVFKNDVLVGKSQVGLE
jgi:hypothetical protein